MNLFWSDLGSWLELIQRLTLALLAGGVIGWNRHTRGKAAGLRTYMLVSLSAALFIMVLSESSSEPLPSAISRVIQGIATGIGFLGAGMIVHQSLTDGEHHDRIEGLTSAAGIWVAAALGILAACGLWQITLIGTLLAILILNGGLWLERFIRRRREE